MIPQQARSPLLNWYWTKVSPHNLLRDGLPSVYLKPKLLYRGPGILWTSFIYLEVRVPVCSLLHSPQVLVPFLIVRAGASGRFLWLSQLILVPAQITLKVWLSLHEEVIFPFRLVGFVYFWKNQVIFAAKFVQNPSFVFSVSAGIRFFSVRQLIAHLTAVRSLPLLNSSDVWKYLIVSTKRLVLMNAAVILQDSMKFTGKE